MAPHYLGLFTSTARGDPDDDDDDDDRDDHDNGDDGSGLFCLALPDETTREIERMYRMLKYKRLMSCLCPISGVLSYIRTDDNIRVSFFDRI